MILNPLIRFLRLPCGTIVSGPMPGSAGFQPAKRNPAGKACPGPDSGMPALPGERRHSQTPSQEAQQAQGYSG